MRQTPSVARRAVLAVALLIGFYVLAIAIAAALLSIPWLEYRLIGRVEGRLGFFAVVGAGAILWALVPRPDRFDDPGPALREADHPRLFEVLRGVARDTGQAMPAEVFLVPNLNAWVAQRGGVMGFGSRRVMGLGLPLLEALSVRQFRAVLAHEFGHYYGGDTRLGPWIYKTRAAIERTLRNVHAHSGMLAKPFQWYGNAFVRITHAVSRQQEFSADALAARTVGAAPLIEGLRFLHGSDGAFSAYWSQEVAPVLQLGARPPIAAGFRQFLAVPHVRTAVDQAVERELAEGEASPYDTHPCLRDRVAALAELPAGEPAIHDPPAITLLDAPDRLESSLLAFMGGPDAPPLESVPWDDVGERVWLPFWRAQAVRHAGRLPASRPPIFPSGRRTRRRWPIAWAWWRGTRWRATSTWRRPDGSWASRSSRRSTTAGGSCTRPRASPWPCCTMVRRSTRSRSCSSSGAARSPLPTGWPSPSVTASPSSTSASRRDTTRCRRPQPAGPPGASSR